MSLAAVMHLNAQCIRSSRSIRGAFANLLMILILLRRSRHNFSGLWFVMDTWNKPDIMKKEASLFGFCLFAALTVFTHIALIIFTTTLASRFLGQKFKPINRRTRAVRAWPLLPSKLSELALGTSLSSTFMTCTSVLFALSFYALLHSAIKPEHFSREFFGYLVRHSASLLQYLSLYTPFFALGAIATGLRVSGARLASLIVPLGIVTLFAQASIDRWRVDALVSFASLACAVLICKYAISLTSWLAPRTIR